MLQGVKKGREEAAKHIAMCLLKQRQSINIVSQVTGLSSEYLEELKKEK